MLCCFAPQAAPDALASLSLGGLFDAATALPMPVIFTVGFMLLFSVVIALFKDIPDAKVGGDL